MSGQLGDHWEALGQMAERHRDSVPQRDDFAWLGGAAAKVSPWRVGDRVRVHLPLRFSRRWEWVEGTVADIDNRGRPGVTVRFDEPVNGRADCYATHAELRPGDREEWKP